MEPVELVLSIDQSNLSALLHTRAVVISDCQALDLPHIYKEAGGDQWDPPL